MPVLENLKEYAERATGLGRPGKKNAQHFTRPRKSRAVRFKDYVTTSCDRSARRHSLSCRLRLRLTRRIGVRGGTSRLIRNYFATH
jgi:hypothetical protein